MIKFEYNLTSYEDLLRYFAKSLRLKVTDNVVHFTPDKGNGSIKLVNLPNGLQVMLLDFISHGNDPGYNYDLNSNNCSSFAIRALRSAGINLPFTMGTWPNGGGYNPGDLGEDIRSMSLSAGMTKSTEQISHPNWGICY